MTWNFKAERLQLHLTLLELGILVLKCLQPFGIRHFEAAALDLPFVERGAADPVACAVSEFVLLQDADDLLFRKSLPLHRPVLPPGPDSSSIWIRRRGNVIDNPDGSSGSRPAG
jgi:hypothetical protein